MRELPKDLDAERVVCAGVVTGGARALAEIVDVVQPADMVHPAHETVLQAAIDLDAVPTPINHLTIQTHLRAKGLFGRIAHQGGADFLYGLSREIVSPDHLKHHAGVVRGMAVQRRVVLAAARIADLGYEGRLPLDEYLAEAQKLILEASGNVRRKQIRKLRPILHEVIRQLEVRYQNKGQIVGLRTGFEQLDAYLSGWVAGRFYVIGARPGMGKTSFAWQAATACQAPAFVSSLEMSALDLGSRAIVQEGRIDGLRFSHGSLTSSDLMRANRACAALSDLPIWIDDTEAVTMAELRAKLRRWRADNGGPALVIVDYLQLMRGAGRDQNREREISEISRGLKALAKELEVPVIALAQLSREVERRADKRPMNSDLRDSGQIEQDADAILFLYRDEVYNPETAERGAAEVIVSKNRFGPKGTVTLRFCAESMRFE